MRARSEGKASGGARGWARGRQIRFNEKRSLKAGEEGVRSGWDGASALTPLPQKVEQTSADPMLGVGLDQ
jgi:hypothetical protein